MGRIIGQLLLLINECGYASSCDWKIYYLRFTEKRTQVEVVPWNWNFTFEEMEAELAKIDIEISDSTLMRFTHEQNWNTTTV